MTGAPGLAAPEGAAAAITAISTAISKLSVPSMTHLVVGAAGALAAPLEATQVGDALRTAFVDWAIAVTSDAVTSHVGALGGSPGVVLAAGTGAVAIGVSATGSVHVVDGAGPLLGDEGGGTWIGLAGLRAALRANDGRAEATPLLAAARKRFGDLGALPARLADDAAAARTIAAFAPDVVRCAVRGDRIAQDVVDGAAAALAATTRAAVRATAAEGSVAVAVVGGLTHLGEPLWSAWQRLVTSGSPPVDLLPARGDALAGAALLATMTSLPHESLVRRWRPSTEMDAS